MITIFYRIHGHVHISHANLPGMYASLIHYLVSSPMTYVCMVLPLTLPSYVDVIIQIRHWLQTYNPEFNSSDSSPMTHIRTIILCWGFRSISGYTNPFCDSNSICGFFSSNRIFQITQSLIHSCFKK